MQIICPYCKNKLNKNFCKYCKIFYKKENGILNFIVEDKVSKKYPNEVKISNQIIKELEKWRSCQKEECKNLSNELLSDFIKFIKDYLNDGKFLDVGCGKADFSNILKNFSPNLKIDYYGIDPYPKITNENLKKNIFKTYAEFLPFEDETFDFVLSYSTLDYFLSPNDALIEIKRVLKNYGCFFILIGIHPFDMNLLFKSRILFLLKNLKQIFQRKKTFYSLKKIIYRMFFFKRMYMTYFTKKKLENLIHKHFRVVRKKKVNYPGNEIIFFILKKS